MQDIIFQLLKKYFGFDSFRPLQQEVINAALANKDTLALMPTGGGKSLCYQIPALAKPGLCLVVSPLISLMNDQVQNLRKKNITAFAIHTGMRRDEVESILVTALHSNCKFLFVSPERLETNLFQEYLPAFDLNFLVVDEAHCISQWGYDFRPSYLNIVNIREAHPQVSVIALTASATPIVQNDICEKLTLPENKNEFNIFRQSFERPNVSYSVFQVESRIYKIVEILNKVQGAAIVYCKTRKRTKEIRDLLVLQGISADYYHAGLTNEERNRKQREWLQNKLRVIVSTNAFGMGIDKPDVRVVIHADAPDSLENYYQEAGRVGRDGKNAFTVLLYDHKELEVLESLPDLRYPNIETLRQVYQNVMYYLQLPEGEASGDSYNFDLSDFIKKFNIDIHTTLNSLKALEQEGWLSFNEQFFMPSTIAFTTTKEQLYDYEKSYPDRAELIKVLLRTYEGIYDYPIYVSEKNIAFLMKYELNAVTDQLNKMDRDGIIVYHPQNSKPQLTLNRTRIRAELLTIDALKYEERKQAAIKRISAFILYIKSNTCRSKYIGNYFGDMTMKECGICDNCINKKKVEITKEIFDSITSKLKQELQQPKMLEDVQVRLVTFRKNDVQVVITYLLNENYIIMLETGKLKWKQ